MYLPDPSSAEVAKNELTKNFNLGWKRMFWGRIFPNFYGA